MLRLSIIIPLRGAAQAFEDTLVSVLQNRPKDCEVVVVHSAEYDDPYQLAGEVRFIHSPYAFTDQLNDGFRASRGEVVHVLQCGLEVEEDWSAAPLSHFDNDPKVGAVAPVVLDSSQSRIVSAGVRPTLTGDRKAIRAVFDSQNCSERLCADGPDLMAGFWRKSAWERVGGFDPTAGDRFADLDLALRLASAGYLCRVEPKSRLIQSYELPETSSAWAEGRHAEHIFWRYLARRGWRGSLTVHAFTLAAELLAACVRPPRIAKTFGRLAGVGELLLMPARRMETTACGQNAASLGAMNHGEPVRRRDLGGGLSRDRRLSTRQKAAPAS